MDNDIYICNKWNYQENRENKEGQKTLLIWSDTPTWIIVDDELLNLLTKFDERKTMNNIVEMIWRMSDTPEIGREKEFVFE